VVHAPALGRREAESFAAGQVLPPAPGRDINNTAVFLSFLGDFSPRAAANLLTFAARGEGLLQHG
jgi:hypothetical protein